MNAPTDRPETNAPSAAACAEAAAWIARLHGEDRTQDVEAGFRRWVAMSPEHRAAFEMANDIWESAERLPKPMPAAFVRWPRMALVLTLPRALISMLVIALIAAAGILLQHHDQSMATRVGEQRDLTLEDGTRITLNTASRIRVHYGRAAREVELDEGEAYFEVAKHPDWPFVVTVAGEQVVAHGTTFLVRRDPKQLSVTLLEGRVTVSPRGKVSTSETGLQHRLSSGRTAQPSSSAASAEDVTLSPGERLTFVEHRTPLLDQPSMERVTAWRRREFILDHTPLADAVAEMNRYNYVQLKIEAPQALQARVTGIFRVGDSQSFAQAVAETYHFRIVDHGDYIAILAAAP